jgi:hypothetical protein
MSIRSRITRWAAGLAALAVLASCGGSGSDAPATPPATGTAPVVDSTRATSAAIGPAGGVLRTTAANGVAYTLTVPPLALSETVTIRMAPLTDLGQPALAAGLTGAVQLEPSGLRFKRLATLRIGAVGTLPSGSRRVGFSSANDGSRMQLTPPTVSNGGTDILVAHFSNMGTADWTPAQVDAVPPDPSGSDFSDANFWLNELMRTGNNSPSAVAALFTRWFDEFVNPTMGRAVGDLSTTLDADLAYENWFDALQRAVTLLGGQAGEQVRALLVPVQARAQATLGPVLLAQINRDLAQCQADANIRLLDLASHLQQQAAKFGMDAATGGLDRASFLRKVNDCLRPVLDPVTLPNPLNVGQPISLDLRAQLVFNGRPNPVAAPFQFTITPTDATVATPVGLGDSAGRFTTVFTPRTAAPSFAVRACLVLFTVDPTSGSDICVLGQATQGSTVFSGSISTVVTNLSTNNGVYNENVSVFLRVVLDGRENITVLEARGSYSSRLVSQRQACRTVPGQQVPSLTQTEASELTEAVFVDSRTDPLRRGNFNFFGLLVATAETFVNATVDCAKTTTTNRSQTPFGAGSIDMVAFERDDNGAVVGMTFDRSTPAQNRVSAGILVREQ